MTEPAPVLNPDYLARDFASFRALLLDHLAAALADPVPPAVASLESTLVEILAYTGDYLSYYQDAVATEAYLATARQRASLCRHARLLDYAPGQGCSARVWARIEVAGEGVRVPRGTALLSRIAGLAAGRLATDPDAPGCQIFETAHDAVLTSAHNRLALAGPGAPRGGATDAVLAGALDKLNPGDVLIFRHSGGRWAHAVRLTTVAVSGGETAIAWHDADALPLELPRGGEWAVLGNIVLADQGRSQAMALPEVRSGTPAEVAIACPGLAFVAPYRHEDASRCPASEAMDLDPGSAEPAIALFERADFLTAAALARREPWTGRRDLIHASQFERVFAVEPRGDGTVGLRFGDGVHGRRLQPGWDYVVRTRNGQGALGNVAANVLAHIVSDDARIVAVSNPLAARGGADPEALDAIRAQAPLAADIQRRCVTEADYAAMTRRFPGASWARAERRWSRAGSAVTIWVRRDGDRPLDEAFVARLGRWLEPFALIGDDLNIVSADIPSLPQSAAQAGP